MADAEIGKVEHKNVYEALSALQGELKTLDKNKTVVIKPRDKPEYSFKYTPLDSIMEALYPLLGKHGLSVRHEIKDVSGGKEVEAVLTHSTATREGEVIRDKKTEGSDFPVVYEREFSPQITNEVRSGGIKITGTDMKDVGGQITYARRYTIALLMGIASDEDNDVSQLQERVATMEKSIFITTKNGIEKETTDAGLKTKIDFLDKQLTSVKNGKAGSLGLSEAQLDELIKLAGSRRIALKDGTLAAADEAPPAPGENDDTISGEQVEQAA